MKMTISTRLANRNGDIDMIFWGSELEKNTGFSDWVWISDFSDFRFGFSYPNPNSNSKNQKIRKTNPIRKPGFFGFGPQNTYVVLIWCILALHGYIFLNLKRVKALWQVLEQKNSKNDQKSTICLDSSSFWS